MPVENIVIALLAIGTGALIQGSVGFGLSLTAVPTMALLRPEAIPATLLLVALPMTIFMTLRERYSINLTDFTWITGGRLVGTLFGAGILVVIPEAFLAKLFGILIVAAALMSLVGPSFEVRKETQLVGGFVSGVMSTAAALGGPPLALVNQRRSGPELRSTLAVSFMLGIIMSLVALAFTNRIEGWHLLLSLQLLPGLLIGLWASRSTAKFIDERWVRPIVLGFAIASGLVVVALGPLG